MKFLSSSPSSSTSTATAASSAAGCLATSLRRLLCFNILPAYPTNQINDIDFDSVAFNKLGFLETEEKTGDAITDNNNPGIVARLMGLEISPRIGFSNTQKKPNYANRSQSMDCGSSKESGLLQAQHRRAKTCLSFHEMPAFYEHEEFLVLSFENSGEDNEPRSKGGTLKARKARKCRRRKSERRGRVAGEEEDKENQQSDKRVDQRVSQSGIFSENSDIAREGIDVVETESSSENSSPVSVLDFCESVFKPLVPTSEDDGSGKGSNSRRKLSTKLENHEHSSPPCEPSNSSSDIPPRKMIHGKSYGSIQNDSQRENYSRIQREICKIAEAEMMESDWVKRALWKLEDYKDISAEFELEILQDLLNEVVDQLLEASPENF